ncbi:NACHT domain-containing protein [Actinomadura madurae]|uniref:NACHT domain-containing protein n=1 Tax=Actinomadura madurae TaxID=1993 RepID=UPI000DCFAA35|nr:NACHT domain-containing protein [Actinomadura madurae]
MRRRPWVAAAWAGLMGVLLALLGNMATNTVAVHGKGVPLVWGGLALATAVVVVGQVRQDGGLPSTLEETVRSLRETVRVQWREEERILGLANPSPMPVRWALTVEVERRDAAGRVNLGGPAVWTGSGDNIEDLVARFKELPSRRLVILGGPGAGKTTLAIQLLLHLADSRDDGPVPVLLSISGWDAVASPSFEEWLITRLEETYPWLREHAPSAGSSTARRLLRLGHVLPVLDGLDEAPGEMRPLIIRAINEAMSAGSRLIITSRTEEFMDAALASRSITGAAFVESEPLAPDDAARYLEATLSANPHPAWRRLLDEVRDGPSPLVEVLANPLGMWLLRTTYAEPDADPSPLLDRERFPTAETLRSHLFDRLIPALIDARPPAGRDDAALFRPRREHDPAPTRRWLGNLADLLDRSPATVRQVGARGIGTRDFAWWRLARTVLPGGTPGDLVKALGALVCALCVMAVGIVALDVQWFGGLTGGVLIAALANDMRDDERASRWTPLSMLGSLAWALGLAAVCLLGVILVRVGLHLVSHGTPGGLEGPLREGLSAGTLYGLALLVPLLTEDLSRWTQATARLEASTPVTSCRADRRITLTRFLIAVLLAGGVSGATAAFTGGTLAGTAVAAGLGIVGGAVFAFVTEKEATWLGYALVTARLARRRRLPLRLMPFLDDAHKLGLLRAVGPIFQFRHAEFHDHLSRRRPPPRPAPEPVRPPVRAPRPDGTLRPVRLRTFTTPRWLKDVAFSPDGRYLALFRDGATDLLDPSGAPVRRVRHGSRLWGIALQEGQIAFSPDGARFAVSGGGLGGRSPEYTRGRCRIFDTATGGEIARIVHDDWVQAVAFSPDGGRLATGSHYGTTKIWDATTGDELLVISNIGWVHSVAFSPDGTCLATGTSGVWPADPDHCPAEIWDATTGQALARLHTAPGRATVDGVNSVSFSPDGTVLAAGTHRATVLWDALTGAETLRIKEGARQLEFTPDGSMLLTAGPGLYTRLWDTSTGRKLVEISQSQYVSCAALSPDSALLVTASEMAREAQLWRLYPDADRA